MITAKERLEKILQYTKTSYNSLATNIGLKRSQNLYDIRDGKVKNISFELAAMIVDRYPEFRKDWLLTGEGDMTLDYLEKKPTSPRLEARPIRLADPFGLEATGEKIYELNDGSLMMEVPVVTQRAYAGYLRGFADPEFYEDLGTIPVMIDRRAFSTYMAFEVYGDSMVCLDTFELAEKSIFPGRIAVGRLLDQSKWQYKLHTHNYDAWVIVHKTEGILIKTITKHDVDNGVITIHSLNPLYKDQDLHLSDIEQIFSIVKIEQKKR